MTISGLDKLLIHSVSNTGMAEALQLAASIARRGDLTPQQLADRYEHMVEHCQGKADECQRLAKEKIDNGEHD